MISARRKYRIKRAKRAIKASDRITMQMQIGMDSVKGDTRRALDRRSSVQEFVQARYKLLQVLQRQGEEEVGT